MRQAFDSPAPSVPDGKAPITTAPVTTALVILCVAVFLLDVPVEPFAFVPAYLFGTTDLEGPLPVVDGWRGLVGHAFVHADSLHLVTNMAVLRLFGGRVEAALGGARFLLFFLLTAAAGALTEGWLTDDPTVPMLGASGAVSGVMGAFLLLHPRAVLRLPLLVRAPVLIPLALPVGCDLGINTALALFPPPPDLAISAIAWEAHLGGFAAGLLLTVPLRRRRVRLLDRAAVGPDLPSLRRLAGVLRPGPASDRLAVLVDAGVWVMLVVVLLRGS